MLSKLMMQTVFQRCVEDAFCKLVLSIPVTSKNMPDLLVSVVLHHKHAAIAQLQVLGLVDCDLSIKTPPHPHPQVLCSTIYSGGSLHPIVAAIITK